MLKSNPQTRIGTRMNLPNEETQQETQNYPTRLFDRVNLHGTPEQHGIGCIQQFKP